MNPWQFEILPSWAAGLSLAVHLSAGILVGLLYFRALWWTARLFSEGGRAVTAIALAIGRLGLLGAILALASLEGAPPLLAIALGVLIARGAAMQRFGRMAS